MLLLLNANLTLQCALAVGVSDISPSTVGRYLSGKNIPYRTPSNKKMNKKIEKEIIELFRNGYSLSDISQKYDISDTTVRGTIDKYKNIENYYEELAV